VKKGDIKIKRKKKTQDWVSFDPRISNDKKTFVLRIESSSKRNWYEFLNAINSYAIDEMAIITECESEIAH
jgi:hypothetical protein